MRFVVYGAGAVGGVIGGNLAASGQEVALIARGDQLTALGADGLELVSAAGSRRFRLPSYGRPDELDWRDDDVVIITVKGQHTTEVATALAAVAPPTITVVAGQNGVANERVLLRHFASVLGMWVMLPATNLSPGRVGQHAHPVPGILDVGRYPHGTTKVAEAVAAALTAAGFASVPRPDIMRWKYRKLIGNLGNAIDALCIPGDDAKELARVVRTEAADLLARLGIDVATEEEAQARRGDLMQYHRLAEVPESGSSTWQSLARGTGNTEVAHLNGEIVLLAREHDQLAPANELLCHELLAATRAGTEPRSINAATLLDRPGVRDSA
ncbi:ketopantoate reductase family protein [Microlunatus sp. Y2014]|uniref:ketopantoate reductase family protein n=1 Tax=Microlunatus sp. Y2014 TaxID=3418488 RepID=UPI003DA712F2